MQPFLYFLAGSLVSWLVTMVYYRKSSFKAPEWARGMIERLPQQPISKEEFAKLFAENLENATIDGGTY